ncbi:MAG: hypothetical protein C4B58_01800 [Deltaproteobacteria bacterium]|nr:MAG: hypothetical protein C4B58_01800 [Deltaproteobacteria bacterium]
MDRLQVLDYVVVEGFQQIILLIITDLGEACILIDIAVTRPVYPDCMVYFENHSYPVPFIHVGREVEVRGCAGKVQILADGKVIREHPRGTKERFIYDPSCYEGPKLDMTSDFCMEWTIRKEKDGAYGQEKGYTWRKSCLTLT